MSLKSVLHSLLRGEASFCSLCFQTLGEQKVEVNEEILFEDEDSKCMSEVLNYVLGAHLDSSLWNMVCNNCTVTLVRCYTFIKMCKNNCEALNNVVVSLQEAFKSKTKVENTKTLFLSLNVDSFATKTLYDEAIVTDTAKAHERLIFFSNNDCIKTEKKKMKTEVTELKRSPHRRIKKEDTEGTDSKFSTLYDIPEVSTRNLILDKLKPYDYRCKFCPSKYFNEQKLRQHVFKKHYPRNVKCDKCPQTFFSEKILELHFAKNHDPGVCSQCGKHFANKYVLQKHERNHNMRIVCQDCGRVYRSKEAYNKHISDDVCRYKMKKSSKDGIYQCDVCKKRYCHKPYLIKHIEHEHGNREGYKCSFCPKRFYTPSRLQTHIVKHTQEKNFTCTICDSRFVTKTSLLYHTRLHTGEKPYQCEHCEKAFLSASRRLDHVRRHHMAPSLECDICNVMFKATSSLLKHRRRHFDPNSRLNRNRHSYVTKDKLDTAIEVECE